MTLTRGGQALEDLICPGGQVRLNGGTPIAADDLDTVDLDVGDHRVELRCPDRPPATQLLTIVEPTDDRPQGPAAANTLLVLLCVAMTLGVATPIARTRAVTREEPLA
jgi:hypothetical protein